MHEQLADEERAKHARHVGSTRIQLSLFRAGLHTVDCSVLLTQGTPDALVLVILCDFICYTQWLPGMVKIIAVFENGV